MPGRDITLDLRTGQQAPAKTPLSIEEHAKREAAKAVRAVSIWGAGGACVLFGIVALIFNIMFAIDIANTWFTKLILLPFAAAITLVGALAPVMGEIIRKSNPRRADDICLAWMVAVGFCVLAMSASVWASSDPTTNAGIAMRDALSSVGFKGRLSMALSINEASVSKLGMVAAAAISIVFSGMCGSVSAAGVLESHRMIYAEDKATAQVQADTVMPTLAQQHDLFGQWLEGNVGPGGRMFAKDAYTSYCNVCLSNGGQQPLTQDAFSKQLTQIERGSNGRVLKIKSNGNIAYKGLHLLDDDMGNMIDVEAEPVLLKKPA